jgi:CPA1 family monovalent cation:H+ antiporter
MDIYNLIAIVTTLTALLAFLNTRFLKLPAAIGVMILALLLSLALMLLSTLGVPLERQAEQLLDTVDFDRTLMHGMLSYLLFAGALHVNIADLRAQRVVIIVLATVGVALSTLLVGLGTFGLFTWLDIGLPLLVCLTFGALISPTDPIAVLGILKKVGAPKSLETKITGESLFNDGVGVVIFIVLSQIAFDKAEPEAGKIALLFLGEAGGGLFFGAALGALGYGMLRQVDNYAVEVLITLAMVTGGYALAMHWHLSGPLAVVVAGLMIGNRGRSTAMSDTTRQNLDTFWELIDESLNAVLFMLIGLELIVITFDSSYTLAGLIAIPLVLAIRFVCVSLPIVLMRARRDFTPGVIRIMTWGGLRGGISIALVLSLPTGAERDQLLTVTFLVVVFSILVQGLTVGKLITRSVAEAEDYDGNGRT